MPTIIKIEKAFSRIFFNIDIGSKGVASFVRHLCGILDYGETFKIIPIPIFDK